MANRKSLAALVRYATIDAFTVDRYFIHCLRIMGFKHPVSQAVIEYMDGVDAMLKRKITTPPPMPKKAIDREAIIYSLIAQMYFAKLAHNVTGQMQSQILSGGKQTKAAEREAKIVARLRELKPETYGITKAINACVNEGLAGRSTILAIAKRHGFTKAK